MSREEDTLEALRASAREQERFFSNAAKAERELWVAREFLKALTVPFNETELRMTPQYSDADVLFREARFQIKEVKDPEVIRGKELKESRLRAEAATRLEDLVEPVEARDIVLSNAYLLIREFATTKRYPPAVKASLDLLCYVTRPYSGLGTREEQRELAGTGWRSISCLYGSRALVLAVSDDAPPFLRTSSLEGGSSVNLSRKELNQMTIDSVDPAGLGPVTRPSDNADLSDSELRQRILYRNASQQPTYLLRLEYERRLRQRGL